MYHFSKQKCCLATDLEIQLKKHRKCENLEKKIQELKNETINEAQYYYNAEVNQKVNSMSAYLDFKAEIYKHDCQVHTYQGRRVLKLKMRVLQQLGSYSLFQCEVSSLQAHYHNDERLHALKFGIFDKNWKYSHNKRLNVTFR